MTFDNFSGILVTFGSRVKVERVYARARRPGLKMRILLQKPKAQSHPSLIFESSAKLSFGFGPGLKQNLLRLSYFFFVKIKVLTMAVRSAADSKGYIIQDWRLVWAQL